jgi:hypothetical protein
LRSDASETEKFPALQRIKTKIVHLHASRRARILLHTNDHDKMDGEELALFYVLKMHRRRDVHEIS